VVTVGFYGSARDFYAVFIYSRFRPSRFFTGFVPILRMTLSKASIREVAACAVKQNIRLRWMF
jgi:hypothetical protein